MVNLSYLSFFSSSFLPNASFSSSLSFRCGNISILLSFFCLLIPRFPLISFLFCLSLVVSLSILSFFPFSLSLLILVFLFSLSYSVSLSLSQACLSPAVVTYPGIIAWYYITSLAAPLSSPQ